VKKPSQYANKYEFRSSAIGLGPEPIPTITILVATSDGNLIPTAFAADMPTSFAISGEFAVKATRLLFNTLELGTPGDSLSMSDAMAMHNLLFTSLPFIVSFFLPAKSVAKLDERKIAPAISEHTALRTHTGLEK
jgi:hypothetical protein